MGIVLILIAVALSAIVELLLQYAYDTPELWESDPNGDCDFKLSQPEISDIIEFTAENEKDKLSAYVRQAICPSYYYFILRREIESTLPSYSSEAFTLRPFILLPLILTAFRGCYRASVTESEFLLWVLALALCVVPCVIVAAIYKRSRLKPNSFGYSKSQIVEKHFDHVKEHKYFPVSDDAAMNNYIIEWHLRYLLSIRDTVRRRSLIRGILSTIGIIAYILLVPISE